jgi:TPR repeat protein
MLSIISKTKKTISELEIAKGEGSLDLAIDTGNLTAIEALASEELATDALIYLNQIKKTAQHYLDARKGVMEAQNSLGDAYYYGHGLKKDRIKAAKYFLLAAEQGFADAQYNAAHCSQYGQGVSKDIKKAFDYYGRASAKGHVESSYCLAQAYLNGHGCTKDPKEAVRLFHLAADKKHSKANNYLGEYYANGREVARDHLKAIDHYFIAAKQGHLSAQNVLKAYKDRDNNNIWYLAALKNDVELIDYLAADPLLRNSLKQVNYYNHSPFLLAWKTPAIHLETLGALLKAGGTLKKLLASWEDLVGDILESGKKAEIERLISFFSHNFNPKERKEAEHIVSAAQNYLKAQVGDLDARNALGDAYYFGLGVKKSYKKAVAHFQIAADKKLALGQYNFAYCHKYGQGVYKNLKKSFALFKLAADQGYSEAQYQLALAYQSGDGCNKSLEEAVKYFHLAADGEKGHARAQNALGYCYLDDKGCINDDVKAFYYYSLAAKQKYVTAQANVGFCYSNGRGVDQDHKKAIESYVLAAKQGSEYSQNKLKEYKDSDDNNILHLSILYNNLELIEYLAKQGLVKNNLDQLNKAGYSPLILALMQSPLSEDTLISLLGASGSIKALLDKQKEQLISKLFVTNTEQLSAVIAFFQQQKELESFVKVAKAYIGAQKGDAAAQNNLGAYYNNAEWLPKNNESALKYFQLAAAQTFADAQYNVGLCHKYGWGTLKDPKQAFDNFQLAATQKYLDAEYQLALAYQEGAGCEKNIELTLKYFTLAADKGHAGAQNALGCIYYNGSEVEKDFDKAFYYFHLAAEQNLVQAQYNLVLCYKNGRGVVKSNEQALRYYCLAASQGDSDALKILKAYKDTETGNTPWHLAVLHDTPELISYLAKEESLKKSIDQHNKEGHTPLTLSLATEKSGETFEALLKAGAALNTASVNGDCPVHLLVAKENMAALQNLLEAAYERHELARTTKKELTSNDWLDLNKVNSSGKTALALCLESKKTTAFTGLLRMGADPNVVSSSLFQSTWELAESAALDEVLPKLELDPNTKKLVKKADPVKTMLTSLQRLEKGCGFIKNSELLKGYRLEKIEEPNLKPSLENALNFKQEEFLKHLLDNNTLENRSLLAPEIEAMVLKIIAHIEQIKKEHPETVFEPVVLDLVETAKDAELLKAYCLRPEIYGHYLLTNYSEAGALDFDPELVESKNGILALLGEYLPEPFILHDEAFIPFYASKEKAGKAPTKVGCLFEMDDNAAYYFKIKEVPYNELSLEEKEQNEPRRQALVQEETKQFLSTRKENLRAAYVYDEANGLYYCDEQGKVSSFEPLKKEQVTLLQERFTEEVIERLNAKNHRLMHRMVGREVHPELKKINTNRMRMISTGFNDILTKREQLRQHPAYKEAELAGSALGHVRNVVINGPRTLVRLGLDKVKQRGGAYLFNASDNYCRQLEENNEGLWENVGWAGRNTLYLAGQVPQWLNPGAKIFSESGGLLAMGTTNLSGLSEANQARALYAAEFICGQLAKAPEPIKKVEDTAAPAAATTTTAPATTTTSTAPVTATPTTATPALGTISTSTNANGNITLTLTPIASTATGETAAAPATTEDTAPEEEAPVVLSPLSAEAERSCLIWRAFLNEMANKRHVEWVVKNIIYIDEKRKAWTTATAQKFNFTKIGAFDTSFQKYAEGIFDKASFGAYSVYNKKVEEGLQFATRKLEEGVLWTLSEKYSFTSFTKYQHAEEDLYAAQAALAAAKLKTDNAAEIAERQKAFDEAKAKVEATYKLTFKGKAAEIFNASCTAVEEDQKTLDAAKKEQDDLLKKGTATEAEKTAAQLKVDNATLALTKSKAQLDLDKKAYGNSLSTIEEASFLHQCNQIMDYKISGEKANLAALKAVIEDTDKTIKHLRNLPELNADNIRNKYYTKDGAIEDIARAIVQELRTLGYIHSDAEAQEMYAHLEQSYKGAKHAHTKQNNLAARIQDVLDAGKARAAGHANALEQDRANLDKTRSQQEVALKTLEKEHLTLKEADAAATASQVFCTNEDKEAISAQRAKGDEKHVKDFKQNEEAIALALFEQKDYFKQKDEYYTETIGGLQKPYPKPPSKTKMMLKQLYKAAINIAIEKVLTKLPVVGQAVNAIQVAVYTVQNKLQGKSWGSSFCKAVIKTAVSMLSVNGQLAYKASKCALDKDYKNLGSCLASFVCPEASAGLSLVAVGKSIHKGDFIGAGLGLGSTIVNYKADKAAQTAVNAQKTVDRDSKSGNVIGMNDAIARRDTALETGAGLSSSITAVELVKTFHDHGTEAAAGMVGGLIGGHFGGKIGDFVEEKFSKPAPPAPPVEIVWNEAPQLNLTLAAPEKNDFNTMTAGVPSYVAGEYESFESEDTSSLEPDFGQNLNHTGGVYFSGGPAGMMESDVPTVSMGQIGADPLWFDDLVDPEEKLARQAERNEHAGTYYYMGTGVNKLENSVVAGAILTGIGFGGAQASTGDISSINSADVVNSVTGFGDGASFGGTALVRDKFGIDGGVDKNSEAYKNAYAAGTVATSLIPVGKGVQMLTKGGQSAVKGGGLVIKEGVTPAYNASKTLKAVDKIDTAFPPTKTTELGKGFPKRDLPRSPGGRPTPDPEFKGTKHTQLGMRDGRKSSYAKAREFGKDNIVKKEIEFTDHGRKGHANPHQHKYEPNKTGGTARRLDAEPLCNSFENYPKGTNKP